MSHFGPSPADQVEQQARRRLHNSPRWNALVKLVADQPGIPLVAAAWQLWREGHFMDFEDINSVGRALHQALSWETVLGVTLRRQGYYIVLLPTLTRLNPSAGPPLRAHDHPEIQATFPGEADYEARLAEHLP